MLVMSDVRQLKACIYPGLFGNPRRKLPQVEEFEFELNEVYSIDIVMSTGEGQQNKINQSDILSHNRSEQSDDSGIKYQGSII